MDEIISEFAEETPNAPTEEYIEPTSKVYVLTDEQNRILRCEGGYTMANISDIDAWMLIDEGYGDKYNLCQSHYFDGGLRTEDGILRWKLVDGNPAERTEEELDADRAEIPASPPTPEQRIAELEAENAELQDALLEVGSIIAEQDEHNAMLEDAILELAEIIGGM